MIYSLYHWWTATPMDDNGLPLWVDVIGGVVDAVVLLGLYVAVSGLL